MKPVERVLIDVGSSTVKVYEQVQNSAKLVATHTIRFKDDFDEKVGLSEEKKNALFRLIRKAQKKYKNTPVKLFATALYRKMTSEVRTGFVDEFFEKTGLFFNIIDHDLESFYLQVALIGKLKSRDNVLLINIGGGSTELIVVSNTKPIESVNVDLGVGTILKKFPEINESISKLDIEYVVSYVDSLLPELKNKAKIAFYSGGELTYMQLAGYNLQNNGLFEDPDHPSVIKYKDFEKRNKEVFKSVTLSELENLMPNNPTWMHGARACSAVAQAICRKYGIKTIVPSDSNLIDGVIRQEFRHVTISGSFRKHLNEICKVKERLAKNEVNILSPRFTKPKNPKDEFVVFEGEESRSPLMLERRHLDSISDSDALIVCNPNGYVGASAMIEIGYANKLGKRVIFVEEPEEFMLKTLPAEVGF